MCVFASITSSCSVQVIHCLYKKTAGCVGSLSSLLSRFCLTTNWLLQIDRSCRIRRDLLFTSHPTAHILYTYLHKHVCLRGPLWIWPVVCDNDWEQANICVCCVRSNWKCVCSCTVGTLKRLWLMTRGCVEPVWKELNFYVFKYIEAATLPTHSKRCIKWWYNNQTHLETLFVFQQQVSSWLICKTHCNYCTLGMNSPLSNAHTDLFVRYTQTPTENKHLSENKY